MTKEKTATIFTIIVKMSSCRPFAIISVQIVHTTLLRRTLAGGYFLQQFMLLSPYYSMQSGMTKALTLITNLTKKFLGQRQIWHKNIIITL
jgi:hypothetical protein